MPDSRCEGTSTRSRSDSPARVEAGATTVRVSERGQQEEETVALVMTLLFDGIQGSGGLESMCCGRSGELGVSGRERFGAGAQRGVQDAAVGHPQACVALGARPVAATNLSRRPGLGDLSVGATFLNGSPRCEVSRNRPGRPIVTSLLTALVKKEIGLPPT